MLVTCRSIARSQSLVVVVVPETDFAYEVEHALARAPLAVLGDVRLHGTLDGLTPVISIASRIRSSLISTALSIELSTQALNP